MTDMQACGITPQAVATHNSDAFLIDACNAYIHSDRAWLTLDRATGVDAAPCCAAVALAAWTRELRDLAADVQATTLRGLAAKARAILRDPPEDSLMRSLALDVFSLAHSRREAQ
jgi:hypothetical protein